MNNILVKDIPILDRPRERLLKYGVINLSNEELLSIVLKTGVKGHSVKDLSNNILKEINDITDLKDITLNKLISINGIGLVKATTLLAAIELGKRVYTNKNNNIIKFNNSKDIYNYIKDKLLYKNQEYFYTLYLNENNKLIEDKLLFIGTLNKANVHPREIFKYAYLNNSTKIVLIHNHPSNNVLPSKADIQLTKNIIDIGKIQDIHVIDHIIIGNNNYYSFYDNNDF
jgi:DNA repair protein RadC